MPSVRLIRAGAVETEIPLESRDLRLGRAPDNDVVLQDPDKTLSRHHAELRFDGTRWYYLDLNSANGSWVGERRITREELTPTTTIGLGDYQLSLSPAPTAAVSAEDLNVTRVIRVKDTARMPAAAPAAVPAAAATGVVGGAIPKGAPPPVKPASPPLIRRIITYGFLAVGAIFAIMIVLLFLPGSPAPEKTAPATQAATTPPPAPPEAPPATPPAPPATPPPATAAPPTAVAPPTPPAVPPATEARKAPRPPPPPPRPRDTDPDAAAIPARANELPVPLQQRRDDIRRRYSLGVQRLAARQYGEARDLFAGVQKEAPAFRDVAARLAEADAGLRQQAAESFKAAAKLEESGDWVAAMRAYEQLRPYEASLPGLSDAVERTRKRMNDAGVDALTRARQFDSRGRVPEAVAWYQRAVAWLPPDHPGVETAKQRLAQLGRQ